MMRSRLWRPIYMWIAADAVLGLVATAYGSDADEAPEGCGKAAVEQTIQGFTGSFNDGTILGRVDEFFAPSGVFEWYSVSGPGGRIDPEARNRSTLATYLDGRSQLGERIELVKLGTEYEAARDIAHIVFQIRRTAPDIDGAPILEGKGAVDCRLGRIVAWGVG